MKAVFVTGGKQYTVAEGDVLFIEKLAVEAEQIVKFWLSWTARIPRSVLPWSKALLSRLRS